MLLWSMMPLLPMGALAMDEFDVSVERSMARWEAIQRMPSTSYPHAEQRMIDAGKARAQEFQAQQRYYEEQAYRGAQLEQLQRIERALRQPRTSGPCPYLAATC